MQQFVLSRTQIRECKQNEDQYQRAHQLKLATWFFANWKDDRWRELAADRIRETKRW
jgi:hypothetical protein